MREQYGGSLLPFTRLGIVLAVEVGRLLAGMPRRAMRILYAETIPSAIKMRTDNRLGP